MMCPRKFRGQLLERHFQRHHVHIRRHNLAHRYILHHVDILSLFQVYAATAELYRVNRFTTDGTGHQRAHHCRQHQWQDDKIIARHLEQDQNGGDRCVSSTAEKRRHSYECIGS